MWCVVWVSERAVRCEAGLRGSWLGLLVVTGIGWLGMEWGRGCLLGGEGGVGTSRLEGGRPTWASEVGWRLLRAVYLPGGQVPSKLRGKLGGVGVKPCPQNGDRAEYWYRRWWLFCGELSVHVQSPVLELLVGTTLATSQYS